MVYVFFGHEKYSSGSMFVPDSPYFIGFFLCPNESDRLECICPVGMVGSRCDA